MIAVVTLKVAPDLSDNGFLRGCWNDWVNDAAWYREHPEEACPAEYLDVPPFEQFVAEIQKERIAELIANGAGTGFTIELVEDQP